MSRCEDCGSYLDNDGYCGECFVFEYPDFTDEEYKRVRKYDSVDNPQHYNHSGIECIDAIEAMTENMSGSIAPHAANVLKYMWRCEYKNGLEDIDKAIWYLKRLRQQWLKTHE